MKIRLGWLKNFLSEALSAENVQEALPKIGIEVDGVEQIGLPEKDLVVGLVETFEKMAQSDHLRICQVDVGEGGKRQIVCGAANFTVGDRVPVALPGCILPGGLKIQSTRMRGYESHGMLCSARELGLSGENSGLLLLDETAKPGTPLCQLFPGTSDTIFELEVTSNRGDCMSHLGIARELAAYFGLPWSENAEIFSDEPCSQSGKWQLKLESPLCDCYFLWPIENVHVEPSPDWLRRDLESVGLRSVNNVVDVTNWVLMDSGQPLHAFDAKTLTGKELCVRQAKENENFEGLNHKKYQLTEEMLLVADRARPLAIAGVMGGLETEVSDDTREILLEAAYFSPESIQKTARRLNLSSDAAQRFARGIDPRRIYASLKKAVKMLEEMGAGKAVERPLLAMQDSKKPIWTEARSERLIDFSGDFLRDRFGQDVEDSVIESVLARLGFHSQRSGEKWTVTVPSFRSRDVSRPIDLVEEFVRFYGIEKLGERAPQMQAVSRYDDPMASFQITAGELLIANGFHQCYHYSLRRESELVMVLGEILADGLKLENPLNADQSHLRPSLLPGLTETMAYNWCNGNDMSHAFEIGRVWRSSGSQKFLEALSVAWVAAPQMLRESWVGQKTWNFYAFKTLAKNLARTAGVGWKDGRFERLGSGGLWQPNHASFCGNLEKMGFEITIGQLDRKNCSELGFKEGLLGAEFVLLPSVFERKKRPIQFQAFSTFPSVTWDLSFVVEKSCLGQEFASRLAMLICKQLDPTVKLLNLWLVDVYEGAPLAESEKSLAFRFQLQAKDRTIGDEESQKIFNRILAQVRSLSGARLRDH